MAAKLIIIVLVLIVVISVMNFNYCQELPKIVNLDGRCMRCLCHAATGCNQTAGCDKGYCGPYKISRVYWKDAGEVVMPDDDKERAGAYEDCSIHYSCAQKMIIKYMIKFGRDCNEDGVTDCDDFAMINFNGGIQCRPPLDRSDAGRAWLQRYKLCNPKTEDLL